mmetsp:Transcript_63040/g.95146  ORF Transcript_63040/g.95146 Transcript_63040/m.95146 type:complete len:103 (+) Transcript_63040:38-346(+)
MLIIHSQKTRDIMAIRVGEENIFASASMILWLFCTFPRLDVCDLLVGYGVPLFVDCDSLALFFDFFFALVVVMLTGASPDDLSANFVGDTGSLSRCSSSSSK